MTNDHIESRLQQRLRQTESQIDKVTYSRLQEIREQAVAEENHWFGEYRRPVLAGLLGIAMTAALINPLQSLWLEQNQAIASMDPIEALMEDPGFYLWLDESGRLIAER